MGDKKDNKMENMMKIVDRAAERSGGWKRVVNKKTWCFVLVGLDVFLLLISNRGEEGKGGFRARVEVSSIYLGDYTK